MKIKVVLNEYHGLSVSANHGLSVSEKQDYVYISNNGYMWDSPLSNGRRVENWLSLANEVIKRMNYPC